MPVTASSRPGRIALFLLPAVAFVGLLAFGLARATGPPGPGDPAPAFTATRLEGEGALSLSELRGKPVVLNFWASWCGPCEDEAPMLRAAADRYAGRVAFLGVDIRDSISDARAFVERHDLGYPNVRDESLEVYRAYGLTGQPETFVIDADGRIVHHVAGAIPSTERLFELIDDALARG